MKYSRLVQKKEKLADIYDRLPKAALESFERGRFPVRKKFPPFELKQMPWRTKTVATVTVA